MDKYECKICGWVYDPEKNDKDGGIEKGIAFNDLPATWECPICGAKISFFEAKTEIN